MGNYVVVIGIERKREKGWFITAFVADSAITLKRIKQNPKWA